MSKLGTSTKGQTGFRIRTAWGFRFAALFAIFLAVMSGLFISKIVQDIIQNGTPFILFWYFFLFILFLLLVCSYCIFLCVRYLLK